MATKIVHTREKSKKGSTGELTAHLKYLGDIAHDDHKGLILHPAKNYGCGPTAEDFVSAVEDTQKKYIEVRAGLSGKRTADIWEEAINNMDEGCYHTPAERDAIEKKMISEICPASPARTVWHENPITGECDLHLIFPTKNPEGRLNLERTKTHLLKRMQALDKHSADVLNTSKSKPPKRKKHIPTAEEVAKKKSKAHAKKMKKPAPVALELQIARLAEEDGIENVRPHHLRDLLKRLGIQLEKFVGKTIHVIYGRTRFVKKANKDDPDSKDIRIPRTGILVVDELLDKVFRMQLQIRREKSHRISAENPEAQADKKSSPQSKEKPRNKGKDQENDHPNSPE
jgi:hypothetical protein